MAMTPEQEMTSVGAQASQGRAGRGAVPEATGGAWEGSVTQHTSRPARNWSDEHFGVQRA